MSLRSLPRLCGAPIAAALFALWAAPAEPVRAQDNGDSPPAPGRALAPLRAGDLVQVSSWRERELAGEYPVDEDGNVVLPLLGVRRASDVPPEQLRRELLEEYRSKFRNESIQILVKRRVRVLGEVRAPGLYHVDPSMSVDDVVALAGGPTEQGDPEKIRLVREGRVVHEGTLGRGDAPPDGMLSGDHITVGKRNWLARYATVLVGVAASTLALVVSSML